MEKVDTIEQYCAKMASAPGRIVWDLSGLVHPEFPCCHDLEVACACCCLVWSRFVLYARNSIADMDIISAPVILHLDSRFVTDRHAIPNLDVLDKACS